jgi:hypothetical protein
MECFAILFSFPGGICAGLSYSLILDKLVSRLRPVARLFVGVSCVVLAGLAIEVLLLGTLGAVRCREFLGPVFYVAHLTIFFLGTPALANVLVLPRKIPFLSRWYVAGVFCGFLFTFLVIMQYVVSEALYGINGVNGPYS